MPRRSPTYQLSNAIVAANAGGSVVCLDVAATGRTYRLHAARPESYETIRADVIDWSGAAVEVAPVVGEPPTVAVIGVYGPLEQRSGYHGDCGGWSDGHDAIAERLCAALADPECGSILLVIDSPGGAAAGLQEAVGHVLRAKVASPKRIIGYAQELAASAGYWWLACVCDEIYAPSSGALGCIGARSAHVDIVGALAQAGETITFFAWPPGKIALASELPLSELGKTRGNRDVVEMAESFFAAVGPARGLSRDEILALDGDCLSGAAAVAAGLADGVATYDEVLDYALTLASGAGESTMNLRAEGGDAPEKDGPPMADGDPAAEGTEPSTACAACSSANETNAKFCDQCGASMAAMPDDGDDEGDGPPSSERATAKPGATAAVAARSPRAPVTLAALAGLRAGASMPAILSAIAPKLAVFDHAAKLAGTVRPGEIIGSLTALAEDAKRGVKAEADLRKTQKDAAHTERWALARKLTAANVPGYPRAAVFIDRVDDSGKKTTSLMPEFAEMKLDTLRGKVTTLTAGREAPKRSPWEPDEGAAEAVAAARNGGAPISAVGQLATRSGLDSKAVATAESFVNNLLRGAQQ